MTTPLGAFGPPPDAVAWAALALSALTLAFSSRTDEILRWLAHGRRFGIAVGVLAVLAALLSSGYVAYYLRGGPRIVDATSYYLEARALASGHVAFPVPSPSASFRGRFLLAAPDGRSLAVIFPPGYPAVLALGFLLHAPLLVGPAIAALLVIATALLAQRLTGDRIAALLAAALSTVCAVLRYHTADTMSHGWSALLFAASVSSVLGEGSLAAALAGASAGMLVATRPVTGGVALALCLFASRGNPRRALLVALAAMPLVALFLVEQRLATGAWFRSSQSAYYALADAPAGCFRYGFGAGIGCRFEHGDFVRAHLQDGYGFVAALGTTARRLAMHLADAGNTELFAPLVVLGCVLALRAPRPRVAALAPLSTIALYAPFYFDGNYPGGGARFFADALPFEHALLALALLHYGLSRFALPLAFAGFAIHTSYAHLSLRDREGGRPMYERSLVEEAGVSRGLVFVDTDHGFSLGYDPGVRDAEHGVVVARRRHDARDAILWDRLGRPPAYEYRFDPAGNVATPVVAPVALAFRSTPRFEAEAEYPALSLHGGSALPTFPPCASEKRALRLAPDRAGLVSLRVELPVPRAGRYRLRTAWAETAPEFAPTVRVAGAEWSATWPSQDGRPGTGAHTDCLAVDGPPVKLMQRFEYMDISSRFPIALDYVELLSED